MANPQKENGHFVLANEIAEALAKTNLSSYETQVIFAIFRKTYGWQKKEDWITNIQLAEMTGIAKSHISRTIKKLLERNIVTKNRKKLSFQKDYDQWEKLPKQVTIENNGESYPNRYQKLPKQVTKVTQTGNKKLPKQVPTKETKETITKETYTKDTNPVKLDLQRGWNIPKDISKRWLELFPDINIDIELEKMKHWFVKHDDKKKKYDEENTYPMFIVNWLEKAREKKKKGDNYGQFTGFNEGNNKKYPREDKYKHLEETY